MLDKDQLIKEFNLENLSAEAREQQIAKIVQTVQLRVGARLGENMNEDQLKTFEAFIDKGQDAEAAKWLANSFPNYKNIVAEELKKFKEEIDNRVAKWTETNASSDKN